MNEELVFGVSDFVAYLNQTLEAAYPYVVIEGEVSNFRVSRNKWVYFDLKDEVSSVRFFGTVYSLSSPLEDGMVVRVSGSPRLHPLYGFSVSIQAIRPVGEGNLRRAAELLAVKLKAEGLFAPERKRPIAYPPQRVALITAGSSAAYADFLKILRTRWQGIVIEHFDVQVQGEPAEAQIISAIEAANTLAKLPNVIVLTRGGGSADELATFSGEKVTRAVAGSRVPTLVAIGHEVDVSLAELAADKRASTPSNAAELLTPDREVESCKLLETRARLDRELFDVVSDRREILIRQSAQLHHSLVVAFHSAKNRLQSASRLLEAYDPAAPLARGYALIWSGGSLIRTVDDTRYGMPVRIQLSDGEVEATITREELSHGKED